MKVIGSVLLTMLLVVAVQAQRPRTTDTTSSTDTTNIPPAPTTVKAKYEGGVFGYNKTMNGTLTFDDANGRLLFKNKEQKEVLFIPYAAITSAFADSHRRRPAAATVASHIPYIGLPLGFIKTKVRYLTLQYSDPDSGANGITSFKLENKEILDSVLKTVADKSGMTARGQVYVKKRDADKTGP